MKMLKFFVFFLIIITLFSCKKSDNQEIIILEGYAFGTTFHINYYDDKERDFTKQIDSLFHLVNKSLSTYIPTSDISKINKGDTSIVVDKIFIDNFKISEEIHKKTKGFFDPTIGVLRNAYGFGDTKPLQKIDSLTLDSLLQFVGFDKVKLSQENKIIKQHPAIYFDFNAVAKGYGIDQIGVYLTSKKIDNYLIELGGEILAKGENLAKNKAWVVGIENVDSKLEDRSYSSIVALTNEAMAASGNYRKFRIDTLTGKKYVHTINPITGSAEKSDVTSATVIASTCAVADAYATSFMALGLEKSKEVLKNLKGIEAYLTYNDSQNKQQVFITEGFKNRLLD